MLAPPPFAGAEVPHVVATISHARFRRWSLPAVGGVGRSSHRARARLSVNGSDPPASAEPRPREWTADDLEPPVIPSRGRPTRLLSEDDVRTLVRASGVILDDERLAAVSAVLAAVAAELDAFERLDLDAVEPEITFRAAWS